MDNTVFNNTNIVFNITICIMGSLILFVHLCNLIIKKNKRKDEKMLALFIAFTIFHFLFYLTYTLIKLKYTSNEFVMGFYTTFFILNNIEVLLFFLYMMNFADVSKVMRKHLYSFNGIVFFVFVVLDLINIKFNYFFYAENGNYMRSKFMITSQGYQIAILAIVFIISVFNKKINLGEKIAFSTYCVLPLIATILQNIFAGYAISYATIIIAVEILFFFVNVQKNIDLVKVEEKNKEAQVKLMLSQIQPHFMYNSLSAISTLITIDPEKAQTSLDEFTEYLRRNLSSLTETRLIPFGKELEHIKTYVSLEKMRFNDRINVIYDIGTTNFLIPPLTIQPIVENAIKHGILKKIEGGTVTLTTYETDTTVVVEIKDDGIGFDLKNIDFDGNVHFGLKNISYRIKQTCNGDLNITSKKNVGTNITVTFKK